MATVAILPVSDANSERLYRVSAICNPPAIAHPKIHQSNTSQQLAA